MLSSFTLNFFRSRVFWGNAASCYHHNWDTLVAARCLLAWSVCGLVLHNFCYGSLKKKTVSTKVFLVLVQHSHKCCLNRYCYASSPFCLCFMCRRTTVCCQNTGDLPPVGTRTLDLAVGPFCVCYWSRTWLRALLMLLTVLCFNNAYFFANVHCP